MESVDLLKGKRLFRVTKELKEKVINILKKELEKEDRISLAIVFGGFLEAEYTRDIDVAVYLRDPRDLLEDYVYAEELGRKLLLKIGLPVDIVVLNHVSDLLFNRVLFYGEPVAIKDWRLYHGLRMLAVEQRKVFYNV